eukprot:m.60005 g.60005  ORF g.60005 m.60005 type:complete len:665 (+) comp34910_c0_seq5:135-2129(+)
MPSVLPGSKLQVRGGRSMAQRGPSHQRALFPLASSRDRESGPTRHHGDQSCFSNRVTNGILAMSRPNTGAIKAYDVIGQFERVGIKSVVNLQETNEHAYCGPPLDDSGFSYNPQHFMDADIFFYNFGWKDYGVPTMGCVFNMVRVVDFALQEGKVAVHCHAGLGRTGVVIACYLIYAHRIKADKAIAFVRSKRPKAIQTRAQMQIVRDFADHIQPMWKIFPRSLKGSERFSLDQHLRRQRAILHGLEARQYKHLPKIVDLLCQRIIAIVTEKSEFLDAASSSSRLSSSKASLSSLFSDDGSDDDGWRPLSGSGRERRHFFRQNVVITSIDENSELDLHSSSERLLSGRPQMPRSLSPSQRSLSSSDGNLARIPLSRPRRVSSPPPAFSGPSHHHFVSHSSPASPVQELMTTESAFPGRGRRRRSSELSHDVAHALSLTLNGPRLARCQLSVPNLTAMEVCANRAILAIRDAVVDSAGDGGLKRRAAELEQLVNKSCCWNFLKEEKAAEVLLILLARWLKHLTNPVLSAECVASLAEKTSLMDTFVISGLSKPQEFLLLSLGDVLVPFESARRETRTALQREFAGLLTTVFPLDSVSSLNPIVPRRSLLKRFSKSEEKDALALQPFSDAASIADVEARSKASVDSMAEVLRHLVVFRCHQKSQRN